MITPIYLLCVMNTGLVIEATLDERNQEVTIAIPSTDDVVRRPAQFKIDQVIVPDGEIVTYYFNRVDGSLVRRSPVLDGAVIDQGVCKVSVVVKRAF